MDRSALRSLVVLAIALVALIVLGASQHIASGPPYERGTFWLSLVFAGSGSIVGLLTLGVVLAPGHWSGRVALASAGAAVFVGGWTLFAEWNDFLIWQMIVLGLVESALLVVAFAITRRLGTKLRLPHSQEEPPRTANRVSIKDLLLMTATTALLASVVGSLRPVGLSPNLIGVLLLGGCCAASVVLAGVWIVASPDPRWLKAAVATVAAPSGGAVYAICSRFERLLLSGPWYALVTSLLLGTVIVSLIYLRARGIELTTPKRWTR